MFLLRHVVLKDSLTILPLRIIMYVFEIYMYRM